MRRRKKKIRTERKTKERKGVKKKTRMRAVMRNKKTTKELQSQELNLPEVGDGVEGGVVAELEEDLAGHRKIILTTRPRVLGTNRTKKVKIKSKADRDGQVSGQAAESRLFESVKPRYVNAKKRKHSNGTRIR